MIFYITMWINIQFIISQEKFSKPGAGDHVTALRSQVDDVKNVMTQNIERVLDRGERLENLIDKTEELEASVSCSLDWNLFL